MANEYRVEGALVEALATYPSSARVDGAVVEVMFTGPASLARVEGMVIEIMRSLNVMFLAGFIDDIGTETFPVHFSESYQPQFANENEEDVPFPLQWVKGTDQLAPAIASPGEWNPYRPNLQGGDIESYLDEQAGILREQHNKLQAGDTTFDVARLIKTSLKKEFTLGSLGRFYSEDYGLILARYVQFADMAEDQLNPAPVGRLASSESVDWVVTNDFGKSGRELVVGIGFYEGVPASGSFGWVVTHGPNPFPLIAETEVIPNQNSPYSWTSTGKVGLASRGNVVCRRWGKAFGYGIGAGTVFIALEQLSPADLVWTIRQELAEDSQRITALEGRVTTNATLIASQGTLITQQATSLTALEARIAREEATRSRENQALRNLIGSGADVDAAILAGINLVRAEFATADDAIRVTAVEALRVANQALSFASGIDGSSINATLDALSAQIAGIVTRLSGVTFNLAGMTNGQILKAVQVGTDSLGAGIFEFQPMTHNINNLTDVDTATTPPTNGQALVWDSAGGLWKPGTVGGGGGSAAWTAIHATAAITNPTTNIVVDVTGYREIYVIGRLITASVSGTRQIQVSVNGGVSYYSANGDYVLFSDTGVETATTGIIGHGTSTTAARTIAGDILGINLTGLKLAREIGGGRQRLLAASTSPITHIRLNNTAGDMTGGSFYVWGR